MDILTECFLSGDGSKLVKNRYDTKNKNLNYFLKMLNLLNITNDMIKIKAPENFKSPEKSVVRLLQVEGKGILLKNRKDGNFYLVNCNFGAGLTQNYDPTSLIVTNPWMPELNGTYTIGKDCVLVRHDMGMIGLLPILSYYASELTENELSMHMCGVATRVQNILSAGDNNTIKSAEEFLRKREDGDVGVIVDAKWDGLTRLNNFSSGTGTSSIKDLIEYNQYLRGSQYHAIGIQAPFNMKREALGDSEIAQSNMSVLCSTDAILSSIKQGLEKDAKEVFGLDFEVTLGSAWENVHAQAEHLDEITNEEEVNADEAVRVPEREDGDPGDDEQDA